ncbi:MAG: hypothetical protein GY945_04350 [Rhodobacteraceae bacterium]|nr:hypothetical protein [Paracoccaceae bacterium]
MRETPIDDMIAFALEELLSGSEKRRRSLVRDMCIKWPSVPALSVVFALTSAASMAEDNIIQENAGHGIGPFAYKLAATLAADVYAIESMGHNPAHARDLLHFWRRVDGYFLEL